MKPDTDMKRVETLRELQLISIYIYKDLLRFCKENRINVYLLGGSLIGAVRHKGFIPWDDDIDVAISRDDYNTLMNASDNGWISDKCRIIDPISEKKFNGYIPVVTYENSLQISEQYREREELKICISIFVYDGVPASKIARKVFFARAYMLRAEHALCRADFKKVNTRPAKIFGPLLAPFYSKKNVIKYRDKVIKHAQKYRFSDSELCACNCDYQASREVFPVSSFKTPVALEFEGTESFAFAHYKEHLTRYYGDYMKLPPENERNPKHSFEAWIEKEFQYQVVV